MSDSVREERDDEEAETSRKSTGKKRKKKRRRSGDGDQLKIVLWTVEGVLAVLVVIGLVLCLMSGIYWRSAHGNTATYGFAWHLFMTIIAGCFLAVPVGWQIHNLTAKWGWGLMVLGPIGLLVFVPLMLMDRVVIDDEHVSSKTHQIRFREYSEIRYVPVPDVRGRTKYEIHCVSVRGEITKVPAGDLLRGTILEIFARAKAAGVTVRNEVN